MGKRIPSASSIEEYARVASARIRAAKRLRPKPSRGSLDPLREPPLSSSAAAAGPAASARGGAGRGMESRLPLAEVVGDCVRRWFQDALKEAKAGDAAMQVLVGQMYHSGYGVAKNEQKARAWIEKASKYRSSVWKVGDKHPGYNASDSDSDEVTENAK
ncbi:uncharacterized protein LOC109709597 [Ananas comosus]|uniref:Uncharacterized protein LOC109709597 n=1 Tax=Ananas comosus TaxID=4615 RepID=A0A6P5F2C6_ANACO|nr:uncharacterized protein LOC109709597 [Ananas comosus]XP_020087486.1 uncharacterized protein LOC109709597 [Ananas comosus]